MITSLVIGAVDDNPHKDESVGRLSRDQASCGGFREFQITGLACDQNQTLTGMKEEILLLSWLLVLLRTREDGHTCYEWIHKNPEQEFQDDYESTKRTISMDTVMPGLQSNVRQVTASIFHCIIAAAPNEPATTFSPLSLLLSTSTLSRASKEVEEKVSEYPPVIWFTES